MATAEVETQGEGGRASMRSERGGSTSMSQPPSAWSWLARRSLRYEAPISLISCRRAASSSCGDRKGECHGYWPGWVRESGAGRSLVREQRRLRLGEDVADQRLVLDHPTLPQLHQLPLLPPRRGQRPQVGVEQDLREAGRRRSRFRREARVQLAHCRVRVLKGQALAAGVALSHPNRPHLALQGTGRAELAGARAGAQGSSSTRLAPQVVGERGHLARHAGVERGVVDVDEPLARLSLAAVLEGHEIDRRRAHRRRRVVPQVHVVLEELLLQRLRVVVPRGGGLGGGLGERLDVPRRPLVEEGDDLRLSDDAVEVACVVAGGVELDGGTDGGR